MVRKEIVSTYLPQELVETLKKFKKMAYIKSVSAGIREAVEEKYGNVEDPDKNQKKITEFGKDNDS